MSRLPARTAALLLALLAEVGAAPGEGAPRSADNAGAGTPGSAREAERPRAAASGPADVPALGRVGTRGRAAAPALLAPPRPPLRLPTPHRPRGLLLPPAPSARLGDSE